jgi:hypothetical protein
MEDVKTIERAMVHVSLEANLSELVAQEVLQILLVNGGN